jgi:hypothetical protein
MQLTDERLKATQAAVVYPHDRLVVDLERLVLKGLAEVGSELVFYPSWLSPSA